MKKVISGYKAEYKEEEKEDEESKKAEKLFNDELLELTQTCRQILDG